MTPDDPRHGTNAGYIQGCRQDCCRLAHNEYRRSVWRKRYTRRTDTLYIDSTGTIRRLRALQALGWRFVDIDREMGHETSTPNATRTHNYTHQPKIHIDNARAIAEVYERLSMTYGPSAQLRTRAIRKGWAPPLAWDDNTIDDPAAKPNGISAGHTTDIRTTRAEDLEHIAFMGGGIDQAAQQLHVDRDTLYKWCHRHGHLDVYQRLADRHRQTENQHTTKAAS